MPRPQSEKLPVRKATLYLYDGDYQRLMELFPEVGAAVIIRRVVHRFIEKFESGEYGSVEVDLDL